MLTAAVAATGSYIARSTAHPSAAAATSVTAPPTTSPAPKQPESPRTPPPSQPTHPDVPVTYVPPVLADGRYDSYIVWVERPSEGGAGRLVVDLVQVFHDRAAVTAAVADGMARDKAQYLSV